MAPRQLQRAPLVLSLVGVVIFVFCMNFYAINKIDLSLGTKPFIQQVARISPQPKYNNQPHLIKVMDPFRGLSAKARHIISEAGSIVCGNKTFPLAKLNDDYCDCMNGADEPGTSACKDARFTCADEHLQINSMFVDDGVCGTIHLYILHRY
eukprot:TRINITY_DN7117_c0_g1_i1.p1 TRINITY_DN7117_c0_g1~~TRINITY_DN7117_c0_g1_i1.p1  ORF type:complete len:152 (+),score=19.95 TRINITY_DN7117_c0_g1_i1:45-500(+)